MMMYDMCFLSCVPGYSTFVYVKLYSTAVQYCTVKSAGSRTSTVLYCRGGEGIIFKIRGEVYQIFVRAGVTMAMEGDGERVRRIKC